MLLIAGLGNKGDKYQLTRHNLGFMVIDYLSKHLNTNDFINKFDSLITELIFNKIKIILVKPQTFINCSGKAICNICSFYKIPPEDVIIIYDDICLPLGKLLYKINSSSGGHNGIKSIQSYIGNNFHRIKVGIGRPLLKQDVANYVLSKFSKDELSIIDLLLTNIAKHINLLFYKDFQLFIELVNKELT